MDHMDHTRGEGIGVGVRIGLFRYDPRQVFVETCSTDHKLRVEQDLGERVYIKGREGPKRKTKDRK